MRKDLVAGINNPESTFYAEEVELKRHCILYKDARRPKPIYVLRFSIRLTQQAGKSPSNEVPMKMSSAF